MAILRPPLDGIHREGLGRQREVEVLQLLAKGLPAEYTVFHGVEWSSVKDGVQWFGEIDAIVLCPNASLVLLEIKAGPVEVTPKGIHKHYGDRVKDVAHQTRVQHAALRQRLKDEHLHVYVAQLLVLPDQDVAGGSVSYPRQRLADAGQMHALCDRVMAAVPHAPPDAPTVTKLTRFLDDVFALAPDVSARVEWIDREQIRHRTADTIVPFIQGQRLFSAAPDKSWNGIEKQFVEIPGGQHNFISIGHMQAAIKGLLQQIN